MKKNLILFLIAMLAIASCKTRERIVYFQDIVPNENIATQSTTALKLVPGDKVGVIVTSAILAISGSLKSFDLIYVMTAGGPAERTSVLATYMFNKAFKGAPNYPLANAISTVMIIISFFFIGITKLVEKKFGGKE